MAPAKAAAASGCSRSAELSRGSGRPRRTAPPPARREGGGGGEGRAGGEGHGGRPGLQGHPQRASPAAAQAVSGRQKPGRGRARASRAASRVRALLRLRLWGHCGEGSEGQRERSAGMAVSSTLLRLCSCNR